jgi:hypothetical protein
MALFDAGYELASHHDATSDLRGPLRWTLHGSSDVFLMGVARDTRVPALTEDSPHFWPVVWEVWAGWMAYRSAPAAQRRAESEAWGY